MELFISEHGNTLKSAIAGIFVVLITFTSLATLHQIMPGYDTGMEADSLCLLEIIQSSSPVIEGKEIIYADYKGKFNIRDWFTAKDYDGTDITGDVIVDGRVRTNEKGLHTVYLTVTGAKGYTTRKKINVLVE